MITAPILTAYSGKLSRLCNTKTYGIERSHFVYSGFSSHQTKLFSGQEVDR